MVRPGLLQRQLPGFRRFVHRLLFVPAEDDTLESCTMGLTEVVARETALCRESALERSLVRQIALGKNVKKVDQTQDDLAELDLTKRVNSAAPHMEAEGLRLTS